MAGFQNIGKKDYFLRYGIYYGVCRALFMMNPIHCVNDYENRKIIYYKKAERYLKRKYSSSINNTPEGLEFGEIAINDPIWIYWKQGIDQAPELVKICLESVKRFEEENVIILTDENIDQFIKLPHKIIEKNEVGALSNAALSDLIRFSLLEHFGGTWIDSTVLLTGKLPSYVKNSDFFAYQDSCGLIDNPATITTWLIHAKQHHPIIVGARNMSFAYWEKENHVIEYLLPYLFLTFAYESNKIHAGRFPYANSDYCRLIFNSLDKKYDTEEMKHYNALSSVHKLTYKIANETFDNENNFYHAIIDGRIWE